MSDMSKAKKVLQKKYPEHEFIAKSTIPDDVWLDDISIEQIKTPKYTIHLLNNPKRTKKIPYVIEY